MSIFLDGVCWAATTVPYVSLVGKENITTTLVIARMLIKTADTAICLSIILVIR
jgi:hypothetical protein